MKATSTVVVFLVVSIGSHAQIPWRRFGTSVGADVQPSLHPSYFHLNGTSVAHGKASGDSFTIYFGALYYVNRHLAIQVGLGHTESDLSFEDQRYISSLTTRDINWTRTNHSQVRQGELWLTADYTTPHIKFIYAGTALPGFVPVVSAGFDYAFSLGNQDLSANYYDPGTDNNLVLKAHFKPFPSAYLQAGFRFQDYTKKNSAASLTGFGIEARWMGSMVEGTYQDVQGGNVVDGTGINVPSGLYLGYYVRFQFGMPGEFNSFPSISLGHSSFKTTKTNAPKHTKPHAPKRIKHRRKSGRKQKSSGGRAPKDFSIGR